MSYPKTISDPNKRPYPLTKKDVECRYASGQSLTEIVDFAGTSRQALARWMQYWGVKRRSTGAAAHLQRKKLGLRGPNWRGGRWFHKKTQTWYVWAPNHPRAKKHNGAVQEHLLIAEARIGRPIRSDEEVHHLDRDRSNNSEENLCVVTMRQHAILHRSLGVVGIAMISDGRIQDVLGYLDPATQSLVSSVYIERRPCVSDA